MLDTGRWSLRINMITKFVYWKGASEEGEDILPPPPPQNKKQSVHGIPSLAAYSLMDKTVSGLQCYTPTLMHTT